MCDCLDKMKLMAEEEETIAISNEGRKEAIESCHLSLIGKFLMCKSYNKLAAKNTIRRAWGLNESMQILEVGRTYSSSNFNRSLIWIGSLEEALGLLIISYYY